MKNYPFYLLALILIFCSWITIDESTIKKAEWLLGIWESKTPRGSIYESWVKTGEHEFAGKSYVIQGEDTIVFETIRIIQEGENLIYIPKVKNQNEGQPVRFPSTFTSKEKLVFENPEHDFPQVISYTRFGNDSLTAEISATKNGQEKKQSFQMKRLK